MFKNYLRFVKIEHTLFSLPIVFSGTFLTSAGSSLSPARIFWIFLAVLSARSFGFGVNRILDRDIDAKNPRTMAREIPSGRVSVRSAWIFVGIAACAFLISAGMLSRICLLLSPVPLVMFLVYPTLKRKTAMTHLGLGAAWGIAPLGGFLAADPVIRSFPDILPAILLSLFCIFWVAGFDVIYSLLDEEFDRQNGLYSLASVLGARMAMRLSGIFHMIAFAFLGTLVQVYLRNSASFVFLTVAGMLFLVSHWRIMTEPHSPETIDFAFFKMNAALAFVVLFIVVF